MDQRIKDSDITVMSPEGQLDEVIAYKVFGETQEFMKGLASKVC